MPSIPASQIVSVVPSVIGAGGTALDLSGLVLTDNPRLPIGAVPSFPSQAAVAAYFGEASQEAMLGGIYFLGFDGSTVKPGELFFARYPWLAPAGAWLRGGNISNMPIATLAALSGSLTVTVDGVAKTDGALSLAGATSFSAAAALIATGLGLTPLPGAAFTGSVTANVLTVSAVASGVLGPNQALAGGTVTAGTTIIAQLTSTAGGGALGGAGTYSTTTTANSTSGSMTTTNPPVVFDPISGGFEIFSSTTGPTSTMTFATGTLAASLLLTQANGAVTSQGAALGVPATNMDAIVGVTQDWVCFMTAFDPVTADKVAFAAWNNAQDNEFVYVHWQTNAAPTVGPDTTSSAALIQAAGYSGVELIYETGTLGDKAAFFMGYAASIDFSATNGRATAKFRSQTGLAADVVNGTISANLKANNVNFYGDFSTRNDDFLFFANGSITGPFLWADSYLNQVWMNNAFQLAFLTFMVAMKSIPYNAPGYAAIKAAALDPINAAVNFGAIRAGVTLSAAQVAEVNTAAGLAIDSTLSTRGWYLQVIDPTPLVRGNRGTPVCNFWYCDGQSVQMINIASVEIV